MYKRQQLFFRPVLDPPAADPAKVDDAILDMANEWVKYGIFSPEEGQAVLNQLAARKEAAEKEAENAAKAAEEGSQEGKDVAPQEEEQPAEPTDAPKLTATPLPEPNGPVEAAERRQETTDMLRRTRQSVDPTEQFAALTLMSARCAGQITDPLAGSDKAELPLVACDPATGQALLLDEVPLLNGVTDERGPRLTGEQIDTTRAITGLSLIHISEPTRRS